jgi:putative PepSY-like beta-lactamase-inhibitor
MIARRLRLVACGLMAVLLAATVSLAQDKAKDTDKIPKAVMDALKSKFPKAEIHKWTKEKEGNDVVYDIEFKENGRACEADIKEDGTFINYEKAIAEKDLPKAVREAIDKKYPKATLKEIMEETEVKGKEEKLSAYEVVLVTAEKKSIEVRLSPGGKILEDAAAEKKEEKK